MNVEDLPLAVVVVDADRNIVSANAEMGALVGCETKRLIGNNVVDVLRPRTIDGQDVLVNGWHSSAHLPSVRQIPEQELLLLRSDGKEIDVIVDGAYERNGSGELTAATLMFRRRLRGPRRPRSGVRIVSAISHELRSPLTSVRGYTSLLLKRWGDIEDGERKVMLQQVDRDARRIGRMITELLDISRLESGRLQLHRVEVDLPELLDSVISTVEVSYPDIDVTVKVAPEFAKVWADPDKVSQVLVNLLENACKYASPKQIVVRMYMDDGIPSVVVSDHGDGIPTSEVPRLFQQFFKSAEGRPSGTGLGLWISRGLIEAHGGTLTAESDVGVGSQFRFTLPQRQQSRPYFDW